MKRFNSYQKILLTYLLLLSAYWLVLSKSGLQTDFWNYFYSFSFSLIPLVGGLVGIAVSKPWGMLQSSMGRALFYIAAGLFTWGAGSMIWSFYNFFLKVSAPYPSMADVGFILSVPLWIVGIISLSHATGARFGLKKMKGKLFLLTVFVSVAVISYYLLVIVARGGVLTESFDNYLKLFFDLGYPLGDVIILALALGIYGLSFNYFGGQYKRAIYALLLGFAAMYFADFVFSYTTTVETFYNGNLGDLLFTVALFLITFGTLGFYRKSSS